MVGVAPLQNVEMSPAIIRKRRGRGSGSWRKENTRCNHNVGEESPHCFAGFVEQQEIVGGITDRDREEIAPADYYLNSLYMLRYVSRTIEQSGWKRRRRMMEIPKVLLAILVMMMSSSQNVVLAQQQEDSRCFLDGGGSTETFFIRESLEVGSLLGTLRVIGKPGEDIELSLAVRGERDGVVVPIEIEDGTKNLRLTSPLDKEGETGPSSVAVDVLCERKSDGELNAGDPAFSIPVDVRVTDVNDNSPVFVGAPYSLNLSELSVVGSDVFDAVRALDNDQPGPFSTVEYHIEQGEHSGYLAFQNPLEGSLMLTKHLDYETLKMFKVGIVARDQGSPPRETRTTITVNVQDADDQNPAFFHDRYDALLPEGSTEGAKLMVKPQDVRAFDQDEGLGSPVYYSFNSKSDEYRHFELNRNTGHIYIKSDIPEDEFLQPVTLVVKATQFDNPDRYAVTTLTVTRGGIYDTDLQFLRRTYEAKVLENVPLNSVISTLLTNRPSDRRVRFSVDYSSMPDREFSVDERGDVVVRKVLDYERQELYDFQVSATDGRRNDSANVKIRVLNVNDWDPRFRYPQYEFFVSSADAVDGALVGALEVHDGDKGDVVTIDIKGPDARIFRINKRGELFIQDLKYLNSSDAHIVVVAEDSGIPPRRASVPVVIKFAKEVAARIRGVQDNGPLLESGLLFVILGGLLLLLLVVILLLSAYICKNRSKSNYSDNINVLSRNPLARNGVSPDTKTYLPPELSRGGGGANMPSVGNPVYRRGDTHMLAGNSSRPLSASSRRSSTDTLSSVAPPSSGPVNSNNQTQQLGVALNPLNPRSGSQRYSKNGMLRLSASKVSPVLNGLAPPPTPSIHSNGLPDPPTAISADPNGRSVSSNGGHYAQLNKQRPLQPPNGAIPKHGGSTASIASSNQNSLNRSVALSESSLQQALRDNIFASSTTLSVSSRDRSLQHEHQHQHSVSARIEWPRNSIPRRVKKLSWEDEGFSTTSRDRDISTLTDPNVSVTPLNEPQQIGRAIYF